jgi:hypothetical protein
VAGQFGALPATDHGSIHLQDRHIPVDEVADLEMASVGAEYDARAEALKLVACKLLRDCLRRQTKGVV